MFGTEKAVFTLVKPDFVGKKRQLLQDIAISLIKLCNI